MMAPIVAALLGAHRGKRSALVFVAAIRPHLG